MPALLKKPVAIGEIPGLLAPAFGMMIEGTDTGEVTALTAFATPTDNGLSFCSLPAARVHDVPLQAAHSVICTPENAGALSAPTRLVCSDPRAAFIRLAEHLTAEDGIDYKAMIAQAAVGPAGRADVHPSAIVEDDVFLGDGVQIGPCAVVRRGTVIGARSKVRTGAVIGEAGIAVHRAQSGVTSSQPHLGLTVIGADCEVGVNAVVIRAMLDTTRIGPGTIIGNLCNIGHGVQIGEKVWMSVGCMIGGHAVLESGVTLGMGVQVRDNITLGANTQVGMGSTVMRSTEANAHVFGSPAKPIRGRLRAGPDR